MKVCFLGINGSGKTTLALFTQEYLVKEYPQRKSICLHASRLIEFPAMFFKLIINSFLGNDVICDRYLYDFLVIIFSKILYRHYFLSKILLFPISFLHKFDLTIYLESPFEVIKDRTTDIFSSTNYKQRIWLYFVINQIIKPKEIDTSQDMVYTKKIITGYVDSYLRSRFSIK
jgi:hypothetical protein